jgi:uncharacterized membrane protein
MRYHSTDLILAGAFGWLCGMRSMAGPAVVGRKVIRGNEPLRNMLAVGAAGEMLVDKHPSIPNRNTAAPLAARTAAGAATGAAIMLSSGWRPGSPLRTRRYRMPMSHSDALQSVAIGAVIGGASAFIGTHASFHMRRMVSERTGAPNVLLGAAEDAVVYGAALLLAESLD